VSARAESGDGAAGPPRGAPRDRASDGTPAAGAVPALELRGVTKRFGNVVALDGAELRVRRGTVHALLGENGAGKTTLMRVAFGMVRPDAGTLLVDGVVRRVGSPRAAMRAGIGMVHQHYSLVPAMTVAENVALGGTGRYDAAAAAARVREIGRATGLVLDPAARVAALPVGAQQRVEIVKALARDARLLVLDEPTAVLAPPEAAELLRWLREFVRTGRSAVLISHKLREVLAVADEITVLRRGRTAAALPAAGATEQTVADAMLGGGAPPRVQDAARLAPEPHRPDARPSHVTPSPSSDVRATGPARPAAAPVIAARDLRLADERGVTRVHDATFELRGGEIVGIAAVEGAGHRELLRALAGRLRPASGTLHIPADVGFVPEDRQRDAVLLDFPLYENVALRGAGARRGLTPWRALRDATARILERHDVRGGAVGGAARALSGGNQQKLVLGRELAAHPAALVVDNPTRGLDVRAAAAVHAQLREARDAGTAVVVHSPDLDEVLALADRVLALYAGTVREVPPEREAAGRAMLGVQ